MSYLCQNVPILQIVVKHAHVVRVFTSLCLSSKKEFDENFLHFVSSTKCLNNTSDSRTGEGLMSAVFFPKL